MTALETITATFRSWGWSPEQIAGAEGNLSVESGFDPSRVNPKEGAVGIAQWEGGRRAALQQFARARGTSETDLDTQLAFMHSELYGGPESGSLRAFLAATTPKQAATVWDRQYERSAAASLPTRIATAEGLTKALGGTEDPAGSFDPIAAPGGGGGLLGMFSSWRTDLVGIGLKLAAGAVAGALVIVGATEALKDKEQ